uniref:hypothetical protein n=1 Tax=Salmonella sp. TaxID=599 RepID=UPI001CD94B73|nr:hypothetical protein [Salmonella sp.]
MLGIEYHSDNFQYTIKIDEVYRSDLAAYRAYGNADLRWVFRVLWAMSQKWKKCPPTTLTLPDVAWLRNKIRGLRERGTGDRKMPDS